MNESESLANGDTDTVINVEKSYASAKTEKNYKTQEDVLPLVLNYDLPHRLSIKQIPECPHGLEFLLRTQHVLLERRPENRIDLIGSMRLQAFAQFDIMNTYGERIYCAIEQTSQCAVSCTRDARLFTLNIYNYKTEKVLTIHRKWTCAFCCAQYYCLWCTYGFKRFGNQALVTLPDGSAVGKVVQISSMKLRYAKYDLYTIHGQLLFHVRGRIADGLIDVFVPGRRDDPIAMIDVLMSADEVTDYYKVYVDKRSKPMDRFVGITYFRPDLNARFRALILASAFLMEYVACKPSGDYIHYVEHLPYEFNTNDSHSQQRNSYSISHNEDEKRIIIFNTQEVSLANGSRKRRHHKVRKQTWCECMSCWCQVCFIWLTLGMRRNSLRCLHLILFITLLILIIFLGSSFANQKD